MAYVLIKNWLVVLAVAGFLVPIVVWPQLVTRHGIRTRGLDRFVRIFALALLALWAVPARPLLLDTLGYLKEGESYAQNAVCAVTGVQRGIWAAFTQKSIFCRNRESYVDRFTTRVYRPGEVLRVRYLPETKLIAGVAEKELALPGL